jgi:hypothetical protein
MNTAKVIVLIFYAGCIFAWSMNIWGDWAEKVYEKKRAGEITWFWLSVFGIDKTRENCTRFLKGVSWAGIILSTFGVLLILLFG